MDKILKTCWWYIVLALVWQGLELLIYHQIQPRVVDDIMGLLYLPFIYGAVDYHLGIWGYIADCNR